jgi:FAD/FMN-containing dehydrogenase
MSSSHLPGSSVETLTAMLAGDVFVPDDEGYDDARRAWDLAVDQRPAVVVFAESALDVVRAVRFARSHGMRIAPQGTGHGALPLGQLEGAMLLKTSRMRRVHISPAMRSASAEAGAEWEDVVAPAGEHGLAALAGTSPNVGVTGYTLGGGMGWLARRYGLAANSVTAVELVTPDGRLLRADADHEPDLFWAVRGGGGVGVVTALEMELYPVAELYAGALFFGIERSSEVLRAWREWTDTVPDEVTSMGRLLRLPPLPEVPELLRGRAFVSVEAAYLGDAAAGAGLVRPLRELGPELDTFATIHAPALARLNIDPEQPIPSVGDGAFLTDLPAAAVDTLVALAGPAADTPLQCIDIRHLGGALARSADRGGAQPKIDANYLIFAKGVASTPEQREAVRTYVRALKNSVTTWHAGYDYYNFVATPAEAEVVLPRVSFERLQRVKAAFDPDEAIISAHPVRPRPPLPAGEIRARIRSDHR